MRITLLVDERRGRSRIADTEAGTFTVTVNLVVTDQYPGTYTAQ